MGSDFWTGTQASKVTRWHKAWVGGRILVDEFCGYAGAVSEMDVTVQRNIRWCFGLTSWRPGCADRRYQVMRAMICTDDDCMV